MGSADRLRLESDFHDVYDHAFAGRHSTFPTWRRLAQGVRARREDHALLRGARVNTVEGRSLGRWEPDRRVVAYVCPTMHRGKGKEVGFAGDLLKKGLAMDTWASAWVGPEKGGESIRCVAVGREFWWLNYRSSGWRSNCAEGDQDVEVTLSAGDFSQSGSIYTALSRLQRALGEPLVAIDFVADVRAKGSGAGLHYDHLVAIDLNTAPGLRGTPIPGRSNPSEVAEFIAAKWYEIHRGV